MKITNTELDLTYDQKTQLSKLIDEIIDRCDDTGKDEWYGTERSFASFGLNLLKDELGIA